MLHRRGRARFDLTAMISTAGITTAVHNALRRSILLRRQTALAIAFQWGLPATFSVSNPFPRGDAVSRFSERHPLYCHRRISRSSDSFPEELKSRIHHFLDGISLNALITSNRLVDPFFRSVPVVTNR